jgi:hypothetical protein
VNEAWRVVGLITGRGGWQERIGLSPEDDPAEGKHFTPWGDLQRIGDGVVTASNSA